MVLAAGFLGVIKRKPQLTCVLFERKSGCFEFFELCSVLSEQSAEVNLDGFRRCIESRPTHDEDTEPRIKIYKVRGDTYCSEYC